MRKIVRKRQLFDKKIVLNIILVLFMFLTIGYSTLSTNLNINGNLNVKKYYRLPLYDVLKNEAEDGVLALEYTREHQDSVDNSGTDKIYYYKATSDYEASQINSKRNVAFAGYCWQMFRTTDTGGVKILFNGDLNDGKCMGTNNVIGAGKYSINDNLYSLGSAGYMYNVLYDGINSVDLTYGKYIQGGTNLTEDEYNVISNSSSIPFSFSDGKWKNGKNNNYTSDSLFEFSVLESGNYVLDIDFYPDYDYDDVIIKKNGIEVNRVKSSSRFISGIPLDNLSSDDTIQLKLDVYYSNNRTDFYFNVKKPSGVATDTRNYFGHNVSYENGVYTLVDTIRTDSSYNLSNNRYFCLDGSNSCEKVYYAVNSYYPFKPDVIKLSNGIKIPDYVYYQLYADDVNKYDSDLKSKIDTWFENNILLYQNYLEDTVFCSSREFSSVDYNGLGSDFYINNNKEGAYDYNTRLKCTYETDRFSVSNPKAKLKYPVATINYAEALLLSTSYYASDGGGVRSFANSNYNSYWLMNPYSSYKYTYGYTINNSGYIDYSYGSNSNGIRPVVSLKKGVTYNPSTGDGSMTNPYIVDPIY